MGLEAVSTSMGHPATSEIGINAFWKPFNDGFQYSYGFCVFVYAPRQCRRAQRRLHAGLDGCGTRFARHDIEIAGDFVVGRGRLQMIDRGGEPLDPLAQQVRHAAHLQTLLLQ